MQVTNEEIKYKGYIKINELTLLGSDGSTIKREVVVVNNVVAALVHNVATNKYIYVKQYRQGARKEIIEVIAGGYKEGDDPESQMILEVFQETGYEVDHLTEVHRYYSSPGITSEEIIIYYAVVSKKTGTGGGEKSEGESIEIIELTEEEVMSQHFNDAKTILCSAIIPAIEMMS